MTAKSKARKAKPKKKAVASGKGRAKFGEDQKIKILAKENPKRGGAAKRFDHYKSGMTVAEALKAGVTRADINYDARHEFIAVS